tara:strand:- start:3806 stop:4615 length:810 start_codon:yes stop_codon:yes gene_type:complete
LLYRTERGELLTYPKYDRIAVYLFRRLTAGHSAETLPKEIPFALEDVRAAMRDAVSDGVIDREVKNVADIKYTYDARRRFPAEMEQAGPIVWLQNGKGLYKLLRSRRPNLIDFPGVLEAHPELESVVDQTPPFIAGLLGQDEQAVFTRVRNAGLINQVLGFQAWPIQGHHRTTVSYGQIEIDEVQAGLDGQQGTIVPISGKGGQDMLSWSQALNLNVYGRDKAPKPDLAVRSLGLWRDDENTIWIVEFTPETDIELIEIKNVRRFRFIR